MSDPRCELCGSPVLVISSREGTTHYQPITTAIGAEAVRLALTELRRQVERLRVAAVSSRDENTWQLGFRNGRNETVGAVLALIDAP